MLKRIRIRNFQKWKKLDISFDREISSIVGNTDAGKSAVIRAIQWVIFNKPSGMGFIRKGSSGECGVRLDFDGFSISRFRSKDQNYYKVQRGDAKPVKLVSFKTAPPDMVSDLLNLNGVNLQLQFDAPFWLSSGEMQASKLLNEVVNLEQIDKARSTVSSKLRELEVKHKLTEQSLDKHTDELEQFKGLSVMAKKVKRVEQLLNQIELNKADKLADLLLVEDLRNRRLRQLVDKYNYYHLLDTVDKKLEKLCELEEAIGFLSKSIKKASELEADIESNKAQLESIEQELSKIERCPLCQQKWSR